MSYIIVKYFCLYSIWVYAIKGLLQMKVFSFNHLGKLGHLMNIASQFSN